MFGRDDVDRLMLDESSVCEQDVESPFGLFHHAIERVEILKRRRIAPHSSDIATDGRLRFVELRLTASRDEYVRALFHEFPRRGKTDSAAATCDHRHSSIQLRHF
jgi:hypothetical protein